MIIKKNNNKLFKITNLQLYMNFPFTCITSLCCNEFCWKSAINFVADELTSIFDTIVDEFEGYWEFVYVSSTIKSSEWNGTLGVLILLGLFINRLGCGDSFWKPKAACQSSLEYTVGKESGIEICPRFIQSTLEFAVDKREH